MGKYNLSGQHFGRLTVIRKGDRLPNGVAMQTGWLCKCECGNYTTVSTHRLRAGKTKSCGCLIVEAGKNKTWVPNLKHGHSAGGSVSPTYVTWSAMHQRCYYQQNKRYQHYGGRGIGVCDRWHSFENFLADMGERPEGMTLDRINVDGNYEPDNCRWATIKEQSLNKRTSLKYRAKQTEANASLLN